MRRADPVGAAPGCTRCSALRGVPAGARRRRAGAQWLQPARQQGQPAEVKGVFIAGLRPAPAEARARARATSKACIPWDGGAVLGGRTRRKPIHGDRKSTRLNSSHSQISYAVFCLKKKKKKKCIVTGQRT